MMGGEPAKIAKSSNRGSRPGERRGGRKPGTPNKSTAALKELAGKYTDDALETLASIMKGNEPAAARVSAAIALLDRGHGKPAQAIIGDSENPLQFIARIERAFVQAGQQA